MAQRLIDADTLNYVRVRIAHEDGTIGGYNAVVPSSEIKNAPTIEAIPIEWIICKRNEHNNDGFAWIFEAVLDDWRREQNG